jgi:hypothetical protein
MTIPANITAELASLKAQVSAASPLTSAPIATITAIQLNTDNLRSDIDTALTTTSILDTWVAPVDPISIINGVESLLTAAQDQGNLSLIRGVVGRVEHNIDGLV